MTDKMQLVHTGSVKNIYSGSYQEKSCFFFHFSNRYSVFDWGEMPDEIEDKGTSLCHMAYDFFELLKNPNNWRNWEGKNQATSLLGESSKNYLTALESVGLQSHVYGLVNKESNPVGKGPLLAVKPVEVMRPGFVENQGYDYSVYKLKPVNALVPLEVIFRFEITDGSSLLKRASDKDYLQSMGLDKVQVGDKYKAPILEFSSKLEPSDRYMKISEAMQISGMSKNEISKLEMTTKLVALRLKDFFKELDIELLDGKLEFAFVAPNETEGDRNFMLVDAIGPDELRLIHKGKHLSKEELRSAYRQSDWFNNLNKAKELANSRKERDWKKICREELGSTPNKLDAKVKNEVENIYRSLANSIHARVAQEGNKIFPEVRDFKEI